MVRPAPLASRLEGGVWLITVEMMHPKEAAPWRAVGSTYSRSLHWLRRYCELWGGSCRRLSGDDGDDRR